MLHPIQNLLHVQSPAAAWLLILLSGMLEIVFSISLKLSEGFSKPLAGLGAIVAGLASVWLMSLSLKLLPIGTAYAVWAGIGAVGTAVAGITWLGESASFTRVAAIAAIVGGIVALQLSEA